MKKYTVLLVIGLVGIVGIFFFFYRMGSSDAKALTDFPVTYNNYDQAISEFSNAVLASNPETVLANNDLEQKADEALAELNTKASVRISSLTKNDGDLMRIMLEIADLSGKELDAVKAYQRAIADKSAGLDQFAKEFRDLTGQRQADYARFLELAGQNN